MFSFLWANSFYEIELLTPPPTFNLEERQISLILLTLRPVCVKADSNLSNFTLQNASVSLSVIYANLGPSKVGVHEKFVKPCRKTDYRQGILGEKLVARVMSWKSNAVAESNGCYTCENESSSFPKGYSALKTIE